MSTVPQIIHIRQRRRSSAGRNPTGKSGWGCIFLLSFALAILGILAAFVYSSITADLPSVDILPSLLNPPDGILLQPTRLYDRTGENIILVLEHPAAAGREYLRIAPAAGEGSNRYMSDNLVNATLAALDPDFWNHNGQSLTSFIPGGQPTIAQRLASDLLLVDELPGIRRTLRERLLAVQITGRFGQKQVLEWYLNSASYGRLAYGADAAARLYFGKQATQINLAESAMLAASALNPNLNPMDAPQGALENQKRVIQEMLKHRLITPDEGIQAARQELDFRDPDKVGKALDISELAPNIAPAFAKLALGQLETQIKRSNLERGGLRIITSLDFELQAQSICASSKQLSSLGNPEEVENEQTIKCEAGLLLPTLDAAGEKIIDGLSANLVVLDPSTGQVLAMVGESPPGINNSPLPNQPSGSLVTPLIYLTGFTRGLSPASLVWDTPGQENEAGVQNFDGMYHGPVRLRIAMANDYLVPAEKVLTQIGIENVLRTFRQFNLNMNRTPASAALSSMDLLPETNLISASRAYGIFANGGVLAGREYRQGKPRGNNPEPVPLEPVTVLAVEELSGELLLNWTDSQTRPIITPQLAYLVTDVLSDETARWESLGHPNPLEIGRPVGAKLSRNHEGSSHWALGYTPQLVVGIWIGSDPPPDASGTILLQEATAGLWHAIIQYASQDYLSRSWTVPDGISTIEVCDPSGLLPTDSCPNTVNEIFLQGSEPVQGDTLFRAIQINRDSGHLATVFTSPELVEDRVYMIVPPDAVVWALEAGVEFPPQNYDIVPSSLPTWEDARINSPEMFALLRGQAPISGDAGGDGFVSYRLQVGAGLNPAAWVQIGQDVMQPTSGQLGVWNTEGVNGLYTIQLLVVYQDQSIKRVNLQVTVDNHPPVVRILSPINGEEINSAQRPEIILRAQAEDDIGILEVTFHMDDPEIAKLSQPPYAITWPAEAGGHKLSVQATDQAGNSSQTSLEFSVK